MRTELRANVKAMMERGIIEQRRLVDEKLSNRRLEIPPRLEFTCPKYDYQELNQGMSKPLRFRGQLGASGYFAISAAP